MQTRLSPQQLRPPSMSSILKAHFGHGLFDSDVLTLDFSCWKPSSQWWRVMEALTAYVATCFSQVDLAAPIPQQARLPPMSPNFKACLGYIHVALHRGSPGHWLQYRNSSASNAVSSQYISIDPSLLDFARYPLPRQGVSSAIWQDLFLILLSGEQPSSPEKPERGTGLVANNPIIRLILMHFTVTIALLELYLHKWTLDLIFSKLIGGDKFAYRPVHTPPSSFEKEYKFIPFFPIEDWVFNFF